MHFQRFDAAIHWATERLMDEGREVDTGSWQGYPTEGRPDLTTKELVDLSFSCPVSRRTFERYLAATELEQLQQEIKPNLPWADNHFEERVSRVPSNPGKEYKNWPWWQGQESSTMEEGQFTHTYQERFWPKRAARFAHAGYDAEGLRYSFGDLDDVVSLLFENPYTRQATFPIFFPEDTGAVHGGRVPCTLHYHFLLRDNQLHMWYPIRSCDLVRHFRDDLYMACRLLLWVLEELVQRELRSDQAQLWVDARPGTLYFTAYSFHVHRGDMHHVRT